MILGRAVAYAVLFVGLVLVFVPARLLSWSGVPAPTTIGAWQVAGMLVAAAGGALALWCVLAFVRLGRGTPAPFDAPRRLVVQGPYRWSRNPMYLGAVMALGGAALFYRSAAIAAYAIVFLVLADAFVRGYEEPTLRTRFGVEYDAYRAKVRRWWPRPGAARPSHPAGEGRGTNDVRS
jgi:protein-S-isoprenylcysteine O-methyltransferase Ste14